MCWISATFTAASTTLGMPLETVDQAQRRAIMSPLLVTGLDHGSRLSAGILVFPLVGLALITAPVSLLTIAAVVAVGIGVVWASTWATRALLTSAFQAA